MPTRPGLAPTTLPVLALLLGLAACQPAAHDAPAVAAAVDTAAIGASLDSLAGVVTEAHQTGDADLFASTWAVDGAMSDAGGPLIQGRDAIVAAFRDRPPPPDGATMTIHPLELKAINGEWAYAMGIDSLTVTPEGAAEAEVQTFTFLVLIRKTGEGWQTYREVLSANQ